MQSHQRYSIFYIVLIFLFIAAMSSDHLYAGDRSIIAKNDAIFGKGSDAKGGEQTNPTSQPTNDAAEPSDQTKPDSETKDQPKDESAEPSDQTKPDSETKDQLKDESAEPLDQTKPDSETQDQPKDDSAEPSEPTKPDSETQDQPKDESAEPSEEIKSDSETTDQPKDDATEQPDKAKPNAETKEQPKDDSFKPLEHKKTDSETTEQPTEDETQTPEQTKPDSEPTEQPKDDATQPDQSKSDTETQEQPKDDEASASEQSTQASKKALVQEERQQTLCSHALIYFAHRGMDFLDIFRINLGVGPGIGYNIRPTKYAQWGYESYITQRVGLGKNSGAFSQRYGLFYQESAFHSMGVGQKYIGGNQRGATEVGVTVHGIVASVESALDFSELADFILGFATFDFKHDDRWKKIEEPEQEQDKPKESNE